LENKGGEEQEQILMSDVRELEWTIGNFYNGKKLIDLIINRNKDSIINIKRLIIFEE
jgi:hypothetical protein